MRHQKKRHKIGRKPGHRKRSLAALSNALIEHKRIKTTESKAKALRPFVEPLITRAKEDTTHNRRQVFRKLQSKEAVRELFDEVALEVGSRPGGYTRVIKLGRRPGDGAEMAMIELVDYNDVQPDTGSSGSSRTRRGGGKGRRRQRRSEQQTADDQQQPSSSEQKTPEPEAASTQVTDQGEQGAPTEETRVEEPVAEEQKKTVQERTDPGAEAKEQAEKAQSEREEGDEEEEK